MPATAFHDASPPGFKAVLGVLWLDNLLLSFLVSSVVAILPAIGADLGATAVELSLIIAVYTLAQAIFNILGGRFGDLWGLRRVLLIGIGLLALMTLGAGLAPSLEVLLVLRFLQGMAAAMISSCSTAIGMNMASPAARGRTMAFLLSSVYLGLTLGPLVGGGIVTLLHWRWLFIALAIPALLTWIIAKRFIRQEWRCAQGETLDISGSLLLAAGLGLLTAGSSGPGIMPGLIWLAPLGLVALIIFVLKERRTAYPIIDMNMFRRSDGLASALVGMLINYAAIGGVVFLVSLYLQQVRGFAPLQAALALAVQSLAQVAASLAAGRLSDKLGPERIAAAGAALCCLGLLGLALAGQSTPLGLFYFSLSVLGLGGGLFNPPSMVIALRNVEPRRMAVASGLTGSMRTLGMLGSQMLLAVILGFYLSDEVLNAQNRASFILAMRTGLLSFAALCLLGLLLGIRRVVAASRGKIAG